ncbi:glycine oxidase ThiO [Jeotgalibacillus sp. S-D1]|uniref:glycine oxidase ThiO n=1 Tax=Jeotgalibacillus sp. S-D1 TaxID=2552189 RepID=UPI00105A4CA5|nr:glycine oxidase ThiO [Jeotgalibacillus sp. S-D1]TDL30880.1 glycine oxidase ThiO [Jeotgalibacillus sp. S-D1]
MTTPDVLIVGAGVIGSSIAYELTKRGARVVLADQGQAGKKASSAAAGMLGAQAEIDPASSLYSFAQSSKNQFPLLHKELKEQTGIDIELVQKGMIKLSRSEEEAKQLKKHLSLLPEQEQVSWVEAEEIASYEPALSTVHTGGMWIPKDGHINAPMLSTAYTHGASNLGAKLLEYTQIESFLVENGKLTGVMTNTGPIYCDHVVVAGGAWSARLLKEAGVSLEAYPVKGECFSVTMNQPLLQSTIFTEGCYIVPKKAGRLLVGATETAHTFNEKVTAKGIAYLMERAIELVPALQDAHWEKAWAGIRPQTIDALPYMDVHPRYSNLWIATGHYRNGILLSQATGTFMADLIEGTEVHEAWRTAFRLNRNQSFAGSEFN